MAIRYYKEWLKKNPADQGARNTLMLLEDLGVKG